VGSPGQGPWPGPAGPKRRQLRRRRPARDDPPRHPRPRPAGWRSPMRPGAAGSHRGARPSPVRRPPAAPAPAT